MVALDTNYERRIDAHGRLRAVVLRDVSQAQSGEKQGFRGRRIPGLALAPWVLAGWTLFVWGGRLRNVVSDPAGLESVGWWTLAGVAAFNLFGLALLGALVLARFSPGSAPVASAASVRVLVVLLAALTAGTWLVRGIDIAGGDHSVGFIVVHLVLAVVSVTLAGLSLLVVGGSRARR